MSEQITLPEALCLAFSGMAFLAMFVLALLYDIGIASSWPCVGEAGLLCGAGVWLGSIGYSIVYLRS